MIKKIVKISAFILSIILVLVISLILLIQAGYFNSFIASKVSYYTNKSTNATLKIESIDGNIFRNFNMNNISLLLNEDTLLFCRQIRLEYNLKKILKKTVSVDKFYISDTRIYANQNADSIWNFSEIKSLNTETDTTTSTLNWDIAVHDFQINKLSTQIKQHQKDTYIPEYVESNLKLRALYLNDSLTLFIDTLNLFTETPELELSRFKVNLLYYSNHIQWSDLNIEINNSLVQSKGGFNLNDHTIAPSWIKIESFDLEDIQSFLPELELFGSPNIYIAARGNEKHYDFAFNLQEHHQKISLKALLNNARQNPDYEFTLQIDSLNGEYWTHDPELNSFVKGLLKAKGKGFDFKSNSFNVTGNFGDIKYGDYSLTDLIVHASKQKENLSGELKSKTWIGKLNAKFNIQQIFSKPKYELYADYQDINLKGLPGVDSLSTDLNGNIYVKGQGASTEDLKVQLIVNSTNSEILDYPVNDFKIDADYNKGYYNFEGLNINTPYFTLLANGKGNIYKSNYIHFDFTAKNIYDLISEFEIPLYNLTGSVNGNVSGAIDSLNAEIITDLSNIRYDSIFINKLASTIQISLIDSLYNGNMILGAQNLLYSGIDINSIKLNNTFSNNKISTGLFLNISDSLNLQLDGDIEGFENPLILIKKFAINYNQTKWLSSHDSIYIRLNPEYIFINKFYMNSGIQNFKVHGYFTLEGEENIDIQLENIDLEQLPVSQFISYSIKGLLNSSIQLKGRAESPLVSSNLSIINLNINNYTIDKLSTKLTYENELLNYEGSINSTLHRFIKTNATIPLHLSFNDESYIIKNSQNFNASIGFDSLDIKRLYSLYPIKDIAVGGIASINLNIANSLDNPVLNGNFIIREGNITNKSFGAEYKNIELKSSIKNNEFTLEKLTALSNKKGTLQMGGFIHFKNDISILPDDFNLHIKANNFQALKSNRAELNIDSDLTLNGTFEKPRMKGNVSVSRSRFNADYFAKYLSKKTDNPNPPLLLKAIEDTSLSITKESYTKAGTVFSGSNFYKNLTGEFILQIPGNTWIRGKDMNFELEGSLRTLKSTEELDLFGTLNVKKGFYKIYGKNFDFEKGELTFTGGKELNPQLNFIVIYRFRDINQELRKLSLHITGKLSQPNLSFTLDNQKIEEKDAIAYVLFGKNINQLSDNQKSKIGTDGLAENLAFDQLSNLIKDKIQLTNKLDVVEISGGNTSKSSNVTIGKYITNRLYLSYEQSFSLDKKTKFIDNEKIMLEYQLLRNFMLKATNQNTNSGFDLIFKKTWK